MTHHRRIVFRVHAVRRMFEGEIAVDDVRHTLAAGETIENYPNDVPHPTRLVLGNVSGRPIHVVAAEDIERQETIVITAYEPNDAQWEPGFKRRKT